MKSITRKPRKQKSVAPLLVPVWDMGATGLANQERLMPQERGATDVATGKRINPNAIWGRVREPWVTRYAKQGKIGMDHLATALRVYAAYSGHPARDPLAAMTCKVDGGGSHDPQVTAIDRRREFRMMWAQVPLSSRPVLEHVVLNDMPVRSMAGCKNVETAARYFDRLIIGLEAVN